MENPKELKKLTFIFYAVLFIVHKAKITRWTMTQMLKDIFVSGRIRRA